MDHQNNYTLGAGKVFLARETTTDVFNQVGERYVGNSPGFTLNIESTSLDHFNADGGIRELDASVTTQVNRSGTLTLDDISAENLLLFFMGTNSAISQTAAAGVNETITNVLPGLTYQLGIGSGATLNPQGVRGISAVVVTDDTDPTPVTFVAGRDYEVDQVTGRIYIIAGADSTIVAGDNLEITYTREANVRTRVISGSRPVRGRLRYIEDNPAGDNRTFLLPLVELSSNGDLDLKSADAWRQMPFNVKALKRGSMEAVWIDGLPQS